MCREYKDSIRQFFSKISVRWAIIGALWMYVDTKCFRILWMEVIRNR